MKRISLIIMVLILFAGVHAQPPVQIFKSGKGSPVFFLPGFASPENVWDSTMQHLGKGYSYYRVVYAGFNGRSPIDTPWYPAIREYLLAYIKRSKLSGIRLIGHSMGGNLALEIAAMLPRKVDQVVVVDALPCLREIYMPGTQAKDFTYNSSYNRQLLKKSDTAFASEVNLMAAGLAKKPGHIESIAKTLSTADRRTYVYGYTDLLRLDLRPQLVKIKAPVLLVGSSFPDKEKIKTNFDLQYSLLRVKLLHIAPESNHYVMLDEPGWFNQLIKQFFDGTPDK